MKLIILLAFLCSVINNSNGYFITVDAHAEECFFDKLNQGTKMGELILITRHMVVNIIQYFRQYLYEKNILLNFFLYQKETI